MSGIHEPIVLVGQRFDWKAGTEAMRNVTHDGGDTINWRVAFAADPGVCSCPACGRTHWAEGTRQRCTLCGFVYPVDWISLVRSGQHETATGDTNDFYYKFGQAHKHVDHDGGALDEFDALVKLVATSVRKAWWPMADAPKDAKNIEVLAGLKPIIAHYAIGGGEEQPPFEGWFTWAKTGPEHGYYRACEPTAWRPFLIENSARKPLALAMGRKRRTSFR